MLTDTELERLFAEWKTPAAGRKLVREIRASGPVRALQYRMDGIRTRLVSKKMGGRALYAESRTCEFPALFIREHDPETVELWPQPIKLDITVEGPNGGTTRLQHVPDLFLIEHGFVMEEWRETARLERLAADRPHHFYRDDQGQWHYVPVEKHLAALGIQYRLCSSDEHPRKYLSNLSFLEEYSLESTPPVPHEERERLRALLAEHNKLAHLQLVYEHGFNADHVFQLLIDGTAYVDLHETLLRKTGELIVYRDKTIARADAVLRLDQSACLPSSTLVLSVGARVLFDGAPLEVVLLGSTQVTVRDVKSGEMRLLPVSFVEELFEKSHVGPQGEQRAQAAIKESLFHEKRLGEALGRLEALQNPDVAQVSDRTLRRWKQRTMGITSPQDQLDALVSRNPGNTSPRLPAEVLAMAEKAVDDFHNTAKKPTVAGTYSYYVDLCTNAGLKPMARASFFKYAEKHKDIAKREGKRKAYQQAPIPLTFDYDHPVHGVLPHEVCYCDHTIMNAMLKGETIENLGKPTITIMVDGALSKARAFYLSYRPASAVSVLMCLRDYVRRNGRLPRALVLDNGREFHSEALLLFCSLFGIKLVWRRRSRPRDSSMVERMLGVTEQEVISQLDGNSLALKDPRMVSSTHHPDKHIAWTLPGLHGAIDYFLFDLHAKRIHPRFGISPNDKEKQLILECGARDHVIVRFDEQFKLLTSPHSGQATRKIDRQRGVYVDGFYYWHDKLALSKPGETAVVRVELWRARIVYVLFRDNWYIAQARDGGVLEGRFRQEFELQMRTEARARKSLADKDKVSPENSKKRANLWKPEVWDSRAREEMTEAYALYERLGMTEVYPGAKNLQGHVISLGLPKGTELELIHAVEGEPGVYVGDDQLADAVADMTHASSGTRDREPNAPGAAASQRPADAASSPLRAASTSNPTPKPVEDGQAFAQAPTSVVTDDDYF
jgi:hypothetical protein